MRTSRAMQESWSIENGLGARGARALLVAVGTAAVALSTPPALLARLGDAIGLGAFDAPHALPARALLAAGAAVPAAALVWLLWGRKAPRLMLIDDNENEREEDAMQPAFAQTDADEAARPRPAIWSALVRIARGEREPVDPVLARRRADRHPDAPPRPPLMASRDLPAMAAPDEAETAVAPKSEPEPVPAPAPLAPVPDPLVAVSPMLPRSPEPFTEAEIAGAPVAPVAEPMLPGVQTWPEAAPGAPPPGEADLAALLARFEHGLARRAAIVDSVSAHEALDDRIAFAERDEAVRDALRALTPLEAVRSPAPVVETHAAVSDAPELPRLEGDIELALESALGKLRTLTQQGRR